MEDKLSREDFAKSLVEVRKAYRLLFEFQDNILKMMKYIETVYGIQFSSWWQQFSDQLDTPEKISLDNWAWNWLPMYYSEFLFEEDEYALHIFIAADTGWFDKNLREGSDGLEDSKISLDKFNSAKNSKSLLILYLEKPHWGGELYNKYGDVANARHYKEFFPKETPHKQGGEGYYLEVHDLSDFYSIEETDIILKEFADEVSKRKLADLKFHEIK